MLHLVATVVGVGLGRVALEGGVILKVVVALEIAEIVGSLEKGFASRHW